MCCTQFIFAATYPPKWLQGNGYGRLNAAPFILHRLVVDRTNRNRVDLPAVVINVRISDVANPEHEHGSRIDFNPLLQRREYAPEFLHGHSGIDGFEMLELNLNAVRLRVAF